MVVQVDGTPAVYPGQLAGLGIVIRRGRTGRVLRSVSLRAPALTCNEAEYQAVIAGLQLALRHYPGLPVRCLTDSRVVVDQLTGRAAVRAPALRPLYNEAVALIQQLPAVELVPIPRELNRLADALAWEALRGRRSISRVGLPPESVELDKHISSEEE